MLASLLLPALLVLPGVFAQVTTKSFVTCITKQGPTATASVKTTSKVLTIPLYGARATTVTPKTTVTPAARTSTLSVTVTSTTTFTNPQSTGTITSTSTSTNTIIITSTFF
ncbi:hypothetical protein N0V83_006723 [Neocucurbitaria cava]|uniref:Uncharacterized protein n=1 Tax=Neocucurbitaria cava TaxID=798079 RepID=A0A9W8Y8K1_9PLEO|nr:hypothetical protein N0V83_006723 [Neocucurbitaria cava]